MLGKRDPQANFFDQVIFSKISEDDELMRIDREVDFSFVREETADLYSEDQGRPSYDPEEMFRISFIQFYRGLSDREVCRQLHYNFLYRRFVGLSFDDDVPHPTTLVVYRRNVGEERFKRMFNRVVEDAREKGLLTERIKAVDATHVIADVAIPSMINLLRDGRREVLRAMEGSGERVDGLKEQYIEKKHWGKASKEDIALEMEKTRLFLEEVAKRDPSAAVLELIDCIRDILIRGVENRVMVSFVDPDARFGRKSPKKKFAGYKAHAVKDESDIVTSVETFGGNVNEGEKERVKSILNEDEEKGIRGEGVVGDKLYATGDNRKTIRKKGMVPYLPSKTKGRKVDKFSYDMEADRMVCKEEKESIGKIYQENGHLYYFSEKDCKECPRRGSCLTGKETRCRVYLSESERDRLLGGEKIQMKEAMNVRRGIERKQGEGKQWHGMGRARYRGRPKVGIQVLMTYLVTNVKRMVKLIMRGAGKERSVAAAACSLSILFWIFSLGTPSYTEGNSLAPGCVGYSNVGVEISVSVDSPVFPVEESEIWLRRRPFCLCRSQMLRYGEDVPIYYSGMKDKGPRGSPRLCASDCAQLVPLPRASPFQSSIIRMLRHPFWMSPFAMLWAGMTARLSFSALRSAVSFVEPFAPAGMTVMLYPVPNTLARERGSPLPNRFRKGIGGEKTGEIVKKRTGKIKKRWKGRWRKVKKYSN